MTPRQASKGALHHWCRPERKFCSDDSPKHPVLCMQASLDRHATLLAAPAGQLAAPAGQLAGAAADCCFKPTGCTAAAIHNRPVQVKSSSSRQPKTPYFTPHHTVPWFVQHFSSSEPTLHTQCSLKHGQACAVLPPTRQAASPEPRAFTLLFDGRRGLPEPGTQPKDARHHIVYCAQRFRTIPYVLGCRPPIHRSGRTLQLQRTLPCRAMRCNCLPTHPASSCISA